MLIKKKDSAESRLEQPEIIFHRMFYHYELFIEGASPEQFANYIKESISASFWYLHINNKIAYDVDWTRTKFYDPQKDNTVVYGIVFHGIKYDLEQREGGVLNRRNEIKIPEMFTVSIISGRLGDKTKLRVNFDTQIQDVCGFFDNMKKELGKIFVIKEKRESRIL